MDETHIIEPLQEIASIAIGNAATALSKLVGQTVTVAVPSVTLMGPETISSALGPAAQLSTAGVVKIEGDVKGLLLFSLDPADANSITEDVIGQQTSSTYQDIDQSVLREMVNIVGGATVSALGTFLDMELLQSVPASATDMLGAMLDPLVAEMGASFDKIMVLQTVCFISGRGVSLKFMVIIDPPSTTKILQKMAEKLGTPHATDA